MATHLDETFRAILTLTSLINGCVTLGLPISEITNPDVPSSAEQLFARLSAMAFCQGFAVIDEEDSVTSNARFADFVQTYRPPGSGYVSSPFFLSSVKGCVVCCIPIFSFLFRSHLIYCACSFSGVAPSSLGSSNPNPLGQNPNVGYVSSSFLLFS